MLNNVIFLQLLGCPQGGPGSLGFSMVVCIYYEHQFRCSIYDILAFIFFFRYFDDLRTVVVHQSSDKLKRILPWPFFTNSKNKPTIPLCHLYLKNVHKIPSNFWKENLPFKMTHPHAFGPQKTLIRYKNMERWSFSQVKTTSPTLVIKGKLSDEHLS